MVTSIQIAHSSRTVARNFGWLATAYALLLLAPPLCWSDQLPASPDAAAHAKYSCRTFQDKSSKELGAADLSLKTSDKNALACAADIRFELATQSPNDREAYVSALAAAMRYIDHVHTLKGFDLGHTNWPEYAIRLNHAAELASKLSAGARARWPDDPAIAILSAGIEGSLAGPNDPQITLAAVDKLNAAVKKEPRALGGLGELLIGRSYLDLPPIFGGGATKAIPYLEQARDATPDNARALRYLAEAYDEVGRSQDARVMLMALSKLKARDSDLQLYADEWRMGEGLATRMRDRELADSFAARRAELMRLHPNLLIRKIEPIIGHGGDDPMTGIPQYRGEPAGSH